MGRRQDKNIDFLHGGHWPLQTYGFSGQQWSDITSPSNGKNPTDGPPMIVTSQPPGSFTSSDEDWISTFGVSHDAVFSLMNGKFLEISSTQQELTGIYKDAIPNVQRFNLYRGLPDSSEGEDLADEANENLPPDQQVSGGSFRKQQIQFISSKDTVEGARELMKTTTPAVESESRGIAMRYPMMMAGWGKTVGIRPTDPEPSRDDNKRKNDFEHAFARETWKHGFVDLRWDSRTGSWRGWNDLIADHEEQNLGTLVFSTNPDATCGFPFLKGKLEDVWWVRRTKNKGGDLEDTAGQDSDFIQTGEICTHLSHRLYDNQKKTVDGLSTVFLVDEIDDGESATCGSETTTDGRLEVKTTTFFHLNGDEHGPICFGGEIQDNELVGCMKFDGAQWVPAVPVDICAIGGQEFAVTFSNDKILANAILQVCKLILKILGLGGTGGQPGGGGALGGASDKAGEASDSASDAAQGFDDIPGGKLNSDQQDLADAARDAYDASADSMTELAVDLTQAEQAQDDADTSATDAANARAAADAAAADAAADAAAAAEGPTRRGDPTQDELDQAADFSQQAAEEAEGEARDAEMAADEAQQNADNELNEARESEAKAREKAEDAAEANDEFEDSLSDEQKEDADIKDALEGGDEADQDASDGLRDAANANAMKPCPFDPAGVKKLEESLANLVGQLNENTIPSIDAQMQERIKADADAGAATQKATDEMASAINTALGEMAGAINDLSTRVAGIDGGPATEVSVGVDAPVVCPTAGEGVDEEDDPKKTRTRPIDEGEVDDGGDPLPPPGPEGPGPGGPGGGDGPSGGGAGGGKGGGFPGPGTDGGPPGGGGSVLPPPGGPPALPPAAIECPVFIIKDPCTKKPLQFGPCPTPASSADAGDPGNPDAAEEGGADGDTGEVFPGEGKETFGDDAAGHGRVF